MLGWKTRVMIQKDMYSWENYNEQQYNIIYYLSAGYQLQGISNIYAS